MLTQSPIQLIAFDADDTLWHSEGHYQAVEAQLIEIIGRYIQIENPLIKKRFAEIEWDNIQLAGYGVKGFILSMIETAITMTEGKISTRSIQELLTLGKELQAHPVELLPGVSESIAAIRGRYPTIILSKGELFHQELKIAQSGISEQFDGVEIVSDKNPSIYERILKARNVSPKNFVMIGNSLRSDIEPVLTLGGWGIHIPYKINWSLEHSDRVKGDEERLRVLSSISELPFALEEIENSLRGEQSAFSN